MAAPSTVAVVLAAGSGSRFEGATHKLRANFRGAPMVSWVLNEVVRAHAQARFASILLVTGAVDLTDLARRAGPGVTVLENAEWERGQATSLQVAISAAETLGVEAMVVGLADQPMVPAEAWVALAQAPAEAALVAATFGGERRPPVRIARPLWRSLPDSGDEGARVLMRSGQVEVTEIACSGNPADIDTRGDLGQWT